MVNKNITIGVLVLIVMSMMLTVGTKMVGTSSLFHDSYVPRKALILENYPVRIIALGEWNDRNRTQKIQTLLKSLNNVDHAEGEFAWEITIDLNQDIQSGSHRQNERSIEIPVLNKTYQKDR